MPDAEREHVGADTPAPTTEPRASTCREYPAQLRVLNLEPSQKRNDVRVGRDC